MDPSAVWGCSGIFISLCFDHVANTGIIFIPRNAVCSTCKQHFIWMHYTVCGYIIQSIYSCKMNSLLPHHFQSKRWIWFWGLFLADFSRDCTELHGVLSPFCRGRALSQGVWGWKSLTGAVFRSSLMAGGPRKGITNPWLLEESEETRGLGFDELRQQQRRIIEGTGAFLVVLSISGTLRGAFI